MYDVFIYFQFCISQSWLASCFVLWCQNLLLYKCIFRLLCHILLHCYGSASYHGEHEFIFVHRTFIMHSSDSMVQTQMDRDWFRNVSNSDLVEPNRIRNLIYALLFANFITLKMPHTCTYRSTMQYIHPMLAVTSITFLRLMWSVVYMK